MKSKRNAGHCCFTLIELLIVIVIIAILAAMLLPALNQARNKAQAAACLGNMKQFSTATLSYASTYNDYLPAGQIKDYGDGGWSVLIAPFLGMNLKIVDATTGLPSVRNPELGRGVFRCPSFQNQTVLLIGGSLPSGDDNPGSLYGAIGYGANWLYRSTYYKTTKILSPSEKIFLGDTIDWGSSSAELRLLFGGNSSYVPRPSVGIRHSVGINLMLGDGHVAYFRQNALLRPYNGKWLYRYTFDNNPSY